MRFTDKFAVNRARIAWTGERTNRVALLLGKAVALILLFVLPAHGTMQQIACEHLPTSFDRAADEVKSGKVLRAGPEKSACVLRNGVDGDDGSAIIDGGTLVSFGGDTVLEKAWGGRSSQPFVTTIEISPFQRAPPAA